MSRAVRPKSADQSTPGKEPPTRYLVQFCNSGKEYSRPT